MEKHRQSRRWRAVRRGIGLGLVVTALWCVSLTVDLSGGTERMDGEERPCLALTVLQGELGRAPDGRKLEGWGRLLLRWSPMLAQGELHAPGPKKETPAAPTPQPDELPDNDDQTQQDLRPRSEDKVVEMTAKGKMGSSYIWGNNVCLYNRTALPLGPEVLREGTVCVNMGEGPQILIVHTHGSEAYTQTDGELYEESDPYRTTDCTRNIVRVGEEMATVFRAHGFQVIHDTKLYDYPAYNGCYDRSKAAVEQWLQQYPTIQFILDVHRDALVGKNGEIYKMVSTEAGEKVAQVMMVLGSSDAGLPHPRWKDNLALAVKLQQGLEKGYSDLARPIVLRSKRYNQDLLPGYLLVEVGGHGNTLTEAIAGGRLWADNVARTLQDMDAKA